MARAAVFNPRKRLKLLRTHISATENLSALLILAGLLGIILWFSAQRDNFDPGKRDIAVELLRDANAPDIYRLPMKLWREPNSEAPAAAVMLGDIPPAVLDAEWQPAGRLRQFDSENLFEKINGEAPKFLKQGFKQLNYLSLKSKHDAGFIAIELFDQGSLGGSMGIFAEHASAEKEIEQRENVVFFRTAVGVIGRSGRFFFRVAGDTETEAIRNKADQLISAFNELPQEKEQAPAEMRFLRTVFAIPDELITFQKENVFQYDFAENFWFGKSGQDSTQRLFIHRAASAQAARELYELLIEEHGYDYDIVDQDEKQALLWHNFLKNQFAVGVHDRYVYGVENASEKEDVRALLVQFAENLVIEQ